MPDDPHMTTDPKDKKPTYQRGSKYPAWALIAVPFIILMALLRKHVKNMCVWSTVCLVIFFEAAVLFVEHNSVLMGHWVYNRNRILGPEVWGVPIEEPLIYYLAPPIFVVMVFHIMVSWLSRAKTTP